MREDPRYLAEDDRQARLHAWVSNMPMGAWADDDEEAFKEAVKQEFHHLTGTSIENDQIEVHEVTKDCCWKRARRSGWMKRPTL